MSLQELCTLVTRHARTGLRWSAIPGVSVARLDAPGPLDVGGTGTMLAVVGQGTKRLAVGDTIHGYGPGQYLVASLDLPTTGRFTDVTPQHPALGFGMRIRPEVVGELMLSPAAEVLREPAAPAASPPGVAVGTVSPRLLDAVVRMLRLLDHPDDIPALAPLIEREILWLVMTDAAGAAVRQLGVAGSTLDRVRGVAGWIRERYAEPVRIEELARRARMSPSAFHRAFHQVTAMSPIQFQKQVRLHEARLRLVQHAGDVGEVAYAVGYESPSQFSREYRRLFGEAPSRDAARLRETLTADGRAPAAGTAGSGKDRRGSV
ncbi:AraC family transcriptional regulator [Microbacterium sp. GXF7504]